MADGLSARNSKLLMYFMQGKSPQEVNNIHPDWPVKGIVEGTKRILANASTVYSDAERLAGNRITTARLVEHLSQRVFKDEDEKSVKPLVDSLKNQLAEINAAQKRTDIELNTVKSAEAMKLAAIAYAGLQRLIGRLEERYSDVDHTAIEREYEDVLLELEAENE